MIRPIFQYRSFAIPDMETTIPRMLRQLVVPVLFLLGFYLTCLYSYLLFHGLVERLQPHESRL